MGGKTSLCFSPKNQTPLEPKWEWESDMMSWKPPKSHLLSLQKERWGKLPWVREDGDQMGSSPTRLPASHSYASGSVFQALYVLETSLLTNEMLPRL